MWSKALGSTAVCLLAVSQTVLSFGTINGNGQRAEHERITRNALACVPGTSSNGDCFEPLSIDQLAGKQGATGAVGAPDTDEFLSSVAHCDDADYLDFAKYGIPGTYPRSRTDATNALLDCIKHISGRFTEGVTASKALLDNKNSIIKKETELDGNDCTFFLGIAGRAKCNAIEGLGRALHGVQDFYSHSNWADNADSAKPISLTNPPGIFTPAASNLLDLRSGTPPDGVYVPPDLSTGCFIIGTPPDTSGAAECIKQGRITHATLNKDEGVINVIPGVSIPPPSPLTSSPQTPRGQITIGVNNFELAVEAAIIETQRQWRDFRSQLETTYGPKQASLMVCALTRDHPWRDCTGRKLAIVVDSSGSNQETDPSNLRITAAQEFDANLITAASVGPDNFPDLVTVIKFTTTASVIYPLGDPASASFIGIGSDGGTIIASGVALAISELTKDTTVPTQDHAGIVVFTDGLDSDPSALSIELERAKQLGIRVNFGFLYPVANPVPRVRPRSVRSTQDGSPVLYPRQSAPTLPDPKLLTAILNTHGFFGIINSAEAQKSFTKLVIARGPTNIDSISPDNGGPLFPGVTVVGLTSATQKKEVFTYHATAGQNMTIETKAIIGGPLNVTLHDVRGSKDLSNVATDAQGLAKITYVSTAETDLELIVASSARNSTALFSVDLKVKSPTVINNCNIAANASCQTIGELKCCGTGFVTCDYSGYVFRSCGPGTACKQNGPGVYCDYA